MTSTLSDNDKGYVTGHAPTTADFRYAQLYADAKARKQACDSSADWQWVEEECGFPCPFEDPSACSCGYCALTETGCAAYSHYPFFDCARVSKQCKIDGVERECRVCQYEPKLDVDVFGVDTHVADGPYLSPPNAAVYVGKQGGSCSATPQSCGPGDSLDVDCERAAEANLACAPILPRRPYNMLTSVRCTPDDNDDTGDEGLPSAQCAPTSTQPDLTGRCSRSGYCFKQTTNCRPDTDGSHVSTLCAIPGVGLGGLCSSNRTDTDGFCYEPDHTYTEWRTDFQSWPGGPVRGACVAALPEYRRWCEMPWTRPGVNESDADLVAENGMDVQQRINRQWRTRWRQPFYYDDSSGQCYVTRDYCRKSAVTEGGYDQSYGHGKDYIITTTCNTSPYFVESGMDCCTGVWQGLARFFFGQTLTADFKNLVEGKITPWEFAKISNENYALLTFFSDRRLKRLVDVVARDFAAPGVHLYLFDWTTEAGVLYGLRGRSVGVLADEVRVLYPELVRPNARGHLEVWLDPARLVDDPVYLAVMVALRDMRGVLAGSTGE
jgi:hypothetical protein